MDIKDFRKPDKRPCGMLEGYRHAYEKEGVLAFILSACIDANDFVPVTTHHNHPTMVDDGLLIEVGDRRYLLTKKAIGLLYGFYGA